jgi:hypothetical protein
MEISGKKDEPRDAMNFLSAKRRKSRVEFGPSLLHVRTLCE